MHVAGTGIAPMARGYEPREILLLHPAVCASTIPQKHFETKHYEMTPNS